MTSLNGLGISLNILGISLKKSGISPNNLGTFTPGMDSWTRVNYRGTEEYFFIKNGHTLVIWGLPFIFGDILQLNQNIPKP